MLNLLGVLAVVCGGWVASPPEIELIGTATIAADSADLSGLTELLSEGTPHNRLGSFGSGIAYTGRGSRYIAVNDRGPADGAAEFCARFQTFDIEVDPTRRPPVRITMVATTLLRDRGGVQLVGSLRAPASVRYDAEGVRVSPTGTAWISEEYGPRVDEFGVDGRMIRSLAVPTRFRAQRPSHEPSLELPPHVDGGRQPNRGLEGLAIAPGGGKVVAILQGPLIQDGAFGAGGVRAGVNVRMLEVDTRTGATREFVYVMEGADRGISEIVAVNEDEFLVLERDGLAGVAAAHRGIYLVDTRGATDVSAIESLPGTGNAEGVRPVGRRVFIDLMDVRYGLAGAGMPEKIEGLAFGPDLADGRRLLLVSVDNDMKAEVPNSIYAFAIPSEVLPGYKPQKWVGDAQALQDGASTRGE